MEALALAGGTVLLGIGSALCIYNSNKLTKDSLYQNSSLMQQAHNYLLWTAILCWVIIAILIFLIVLLVIGKLRFESLIKIGLAIVIAGLLVAGGLSVAAGTNIKDLQHPDAGINSIYFQVILSTILFLGGAFLVSGVLIILAGKPAEEKEQLKLEEIRVEQLKAEEVKLGQNIVTEQSMVSSSVNPASEPAITSPSQSSVVRSAQNTTVRPVNTSSGGLQFSTPGGYMVRYG